MAKAARAVIIENNQLLVMHRNKSGSQYYTLVGGRVDGDESLEEAVKREVMEETGLTVTSARHVFTENHPAPYNDQYIFLCEVAPHGPVAIQPYSEEGRMNAVDINIHRPEWVNSHSFDRIPFRTPQIQQAIIHALKKGFPKQPIEL